MPTEQLDKDVVNLAKAIRQTESGGNFKAKGKSGEHGAYQFTPDTWNKTATKYGIQVPIDQATPEQQNEVAYRQIKEWKDKGFNPGQIASMWNAGEGEPEAYQGSFSNGRPARGVNSFGANFDVPAYAKSVAGAYQSIKAGHSVGIDHKNPSSVDTKYKPPVEEVVSSGEAPKEGYSVGGFAKNVLKSAGGVLGGLGQVIAHPIETVKGLGKLALGTAQLLIPGEQGYEEQAKTVGKYFADKYGGSENIKNSLYNDPIGVLLDASTILTGGGALAAKAGTIGKISGLAKVGKAASTAGKIIDPLAAAAKGVKGLANVSGRAASSIGGVTTGVGKDAIQSIFKAGQKGGSVLEQTTKALRGKMPAEEVLKNVQSAVSKLVETEKKAYKTKLDAIRATGAAIPEEKVSTLRSAFDKQLQELDIIRDAEGKLDFRGSILDGDASAMRRVAQIDDKISFATKNPTVNNIDNLKKFAEQAWKPNEPLNVVTQPIKQTARKILTESIDGYEQMTSRYHQFKDFLDEVHAAIGNPDRVTQESALRKVRSIFRDSQKERLSTTAKLEAETGANLQGQVAGLISNPVLPSGLQKYGAEGLAIGALTGAIPAIGSASGLIAASPRIIGETARRIGITTRQLEAAVGAIEKATNLPRNEILKLITQSGKISDVSSNPQ